MADLLADTVRFRKALGFDGFTEATIESSSGYSITVVDTNNYTFTASSGTATTGNLRGGGKNATSGPVTLENYCGIYIRTTLKTAIQDYTENTETSFVTNLPTFIRAAAEDAYLQAGRPRTFSQERHQRRYAKRDPLACLLPTDFLASFSLCRLQTVAQKSSCSRRTRESSFRSITPTHLVNRHAQILCHVRCGQRDPGSHAGQQLRL